MADVKISALPLASTPLAGTEVLPIVQSATTDQVSVANLTAGRSVSAASLTLTTTPLAVGSGGTGVTTSTGSGAVVLGTTPTFTTSALFPAGTVSAPSISVSGDTNTGIYFPAADTIGFVEGGVQAMTLDASGNLSIGTTTNSVFDAVGAARTLLVQSSSSATFSSAPNSTNSIVICNSDTTTGNSSQLTFAAITGANTSQFASAAINCIYGARTNGQYPTGILTFSTSTSLNNAPSEKMRIDNAGNVGIGTASATVTYQTGLTTTVRAAISDSGFDILNLISTANNPVLSFSQPNSAATIFRYANIRGIMTTATAGSEAGALTFSTSTGGLNSAERMRIDGSGNVIINTAAIATNATDGFLYVPTCAGTPTGTPTTYTGRAPIVVNTTNNKLYFYSGGAWRDAGP